MSSSVPIKTNMVNLPGMARRLISAGLMMEADVRKAVNAADQQRLSLIHYLLEHRLVDSAALTQQASIEFGIPMLDVSAIPLARLPLNIISEQLLSKHRALPLLRRDKRLFVGISDPMQLQALDEIKFHSNCVVEPILVERNQLNHAIEATIHITSVVASDLGDEELNDATEETSQEEENPSQSGINTSTSDDPPVVKFVNKILLDAIRRKASDIHFEPYEKQYRVRLRLDGILTTVANPPVRLASRISSRLKVISSLDIAERRVPQDGRIKLNLSKDHAIDFRVSSLPTMFGEKLVLRLLDNATGKMGIEHLGYEEAQRKLYLDAIAKPYGMVLVTGPTGSGKTVSLYNALNILNTDQRNISTVEDPVEIRMEGINQVQQNTKRGMTFATALRSFLRQDPDVIMVGEIRDLETAEIAIKAAQTGHMVLSTLHTNDAAQTIARLINMGIAPYNLTSSITLIVAQRLARRLHSCKKAIQLSPQMLLEAGFTQEDIDAGVTIYEPAGCDKCNNGYKGRIGIYQVMPMLEDIQQIILGGGNALQIAQAALKAGIPDLRTAALKKVKDGITSLTEIDRVTRD